MAAVCRTVCWFPKKHVAVIYPAVSNIQKQQQKFYSDDKTKFPSVRSETASIKRGTGGRSSFSGAVATVFGANGFLGRYVVNKLGALGTQVIIPYRSDFYNMLQLKLCGDLGQILFFPFDLKDEDSLYKVMKYSNVVINLIGRDYETSNYPFEEVHVNAARRIARIARESGVHKLIHVSALNATQQPTPILLKNGSQFLASKWRGENAVREEFPDAVIFRPSDMYGELDRFITYYISYVRNQYTYRMPLWKKGEETIKQPVYVNDVAKGIAKAAFDPSAAGKLYQAVGPHRYQLGEIIDWMYRLIRRTRDISGYRRVNISYTPLFWLRVSVIEKLFAKYPPISWERMEREHYTDQVIRHVPDLRDLGVRLTPMEERMVFEMRPFYLFNYCDSDAIEYMEPVPSAPILPTIPDL